MKVQCKERMSVRADIAEWFFGGHEQSPSPGSYAVMLHNPSITTY